MSAFFVLLNRDQSAVPADLAEKIFSTLDHFAVHGKKLIVKDNFAIGFQSFWTVPEEQGEQQPLFDEVTGSWLVFYGRIDNRKELLNELDMLPDESVSDARLILQYLNKNGDSQLARIVGPFVFVHFHPASNTVLAARDAMGGRYQAFNLTDKRLLIASYDLALAAHPDIGYQLDPEKRIRLLCNIMQNQPSSPLTGISPQLPGQKLLVNGERIESSTFYLPDPTRRINLPDNQAYANEFKRLLTQAVDRRLRSIAAVGSMLSGGMDSVPITIAAAKALATKGDTLSAFSWVFDEHPESDEREYSSEVCSQLGIDQHMVNCDQVWPGFDESTYCDPTLPYASPYSAFNQALFASAHRRGVGTLLSGIGGDMLYTGSGQILYELFMAGRWRDCWREACSLHAGVGNTWRFCKHYLLAPLPLLRSWLSRRRAKADITFDYLSPSAQAQLKTRPHWLRLHTKQAMRPEQYRNVLDTFEGEDANFGKYMEAKYQLERRYPFRDRDLAEFLLAIPSDQLFSMSVNRPIVKRAFSSEFSEQLKQRNSKTNFYPVIQSGIANDANYQRWWQRSQERSQHNCHPDVRNLSFSGIDDQKIGLEAIKWRIAYHEYWKAVCYNPTAYKLGLNHEQSNT